MSDDIFHETLDCSHDELLEILHKAVRDRLNNGIPFGYKKAPNGELVPYMRQQRIIRLEKKLKYKGLTFEEICEILKDEVLFDEEEIGAYKDK